MFASNDNNRFRLSRRKKAPTKLLIDGEIVEGTQSLLEAWSQHFESLTRYKNEFPQLESLEAYVKHLAATLSLGNEDSLLDIPFTTDEVSAATKKLKRGKAPGPDNLMSEHLLEGGVTVIKWLTHLQCNSQP